MTIPPESFDEQPLDEMDNAETGDIPDLSAAYEPALPETTYDLVEQSAIIERNVEDLTVAELIGQFFRQPGATIGAFLNVVTAPAAQPAAKMRWVEAPPDSGESLKIGKFLFRLVATVIFGIDPYPESSSIPITREQRREAIQLSLRLIALVFALYGSGILATDRLDITGLNAGAPYLIGGFLFWLAAELYGSWPALLDWLKKPVIQTPDQADAVEDTPAESSPVGFESQDELIRPWWMRLGLAGMGLAFSALASVLNRNNQFTIPGILAWLISIGVWIGALAPSNWSLGSFWTSVKGIRIHRTWTFWALLLIMVLAAYFRFNQISTVPSEMTSDHVEKLLDSQRVLDGETEVFFPNNGGREPIQFYSIAFLSRVFGLPMNFMTLKLLTAIEGMISIPLLWWMGREVTGRGDPKLGNLVGLILAGLVAASYWHVALSRLGLRIVLTVVFTTLLIIFLSRALRDNRRGDYIKTGLALGFGLYAYQAVRMLPVVIVVAVGMAIVFRLISRVLGRQHEKGSIVPYFINLGTLVAISVVVFVPLLTFSLQYPNDFWRRTSGRLLGDELVQTTDPNGNLVERVASLEERLAAFQKNWPILADNIRNALLMYNWKGDVAWINAAPNRPAMDVLTGALFIIGLGAWLARMIRRRDVVDWLMPVMLFIMLLPSAFSIAYPVENPSATRTSGTLPEAYLFAALPLALIAAQIIRISPRAGKFIAAGVVTVAIVGAYNANQAVYFNEYALYYTGSSLPYSDAGKVLEGFAESGGSFGNAYMIGYDYWWDHRAIGIEAGLIDWPNGIVTRDEIPQFLYIASQKIDKYRLDPEKDLLFIYSTQDDETEEKLKQWFPTGYVQVFQSYQPEDQAKLFRVPALGSAEFISFLMRSGAVQ
jgi:hypothetical protein